MIFLDIPGIVRRVEHKGVDVANEQRGGVHHKHDVHSTVQANSSQIPIFGSFFQFTDWTKSKGEFLL